MENNQTIITVESGKGEIMPEKQYSKLELENRLKECLAMKDEKPMYIYENKFEIAKLINQYRKIKDYSEPLASLVEFFMLK
ncbi:hypothetical protein COS75_03305 [Candidatus Pacearchaeota archaeon CG06_land_8_20_14_3_00_35_12]|nr:MAG: hypothetical protein COS75_03305 [Candidatus Pacearchaeota archaeon CG06_land_8_20_14_3_00_35_12]